MNDVISSLFKSRRFWALALGVAVPILNQKLGLNLSVEEILAIVFGTGFWAVSESIRSSRLADGE